MHYLHDIVAILSLEKKRHKRPDDKDEGWLNSCCVPMCWFANMLPFVIYAWMHSCEMEGVSSQCLPVITCYCEQNFLFGKLWLLGILDFVADMGRYCQNQRENHGVWREVFQGVEKHTQWGFGAMKEKS